MNTTTLSTPDATATRDLILVRLGAEITLKSRRTRHQFVERLVGNLNDALQSAGMPGDVESTWGRIWVRADRTVLPTLAHVFGISSLSPVARVVAPDLDEIVRAGTALFTDAVRGRHFAVRARRTGEHAFTSRDVEVRLGAALLPHAAGVRLVDPEFTAFVEVREHDAYLFSERVQGAGGLPLGVEGHAVSLLSGGFDSAVASWQILKRGVALDYVFCNLGGDAYERAVLQVAKVLADQWSFGTQPRLHVIDFQEPLRELRAKVRQSYWQVVLKRIMYRVASRIGEQVRAAAIITGESIGQVSSQTLHNLAAIDPAAALPVFRPLIGFDKEEIIAQARTVGTATLSEQVREYCAIAPGKPVTATSAQRVAAEETGLDDALLDAVISARKVFDLRSLAATDLVAPYLFIDAIPDDAVVIDCRTRDQFRAWHLPGAQHRNEWDVLRSIPSFDRDRHYVLYCAYGIQSAYLAERLQRAGIEAHSVRGGAGRLMRSGLA